MTDRLLIGTSWKMNLTSSQATVYLRRLVPIVGDLDKRDLFVLPPFTAIHVAQRELAGTAIAWGAQEMHEDAAGAHTGDISAPMLTDLGCRYVELGHSERRRDHHELNARIAAKVRMALRHRLTPILCVGERRRFPGPVAQSAVIRQLAQSVAGVDPSDLDGVVVAYEPVWAIGAGATSAPLEHVVAMHAAIRSWLRAHGTSAPGVIYGGSVDTSNAGALLGLPGVDGLFVGRAALDPETFGEIAHAHPERGAA